MFDAPVSVPEQVLRERKSALLRRKFWARLLGSLLCTFVATVILFGVLFGVSRVEGNSMRHALQEADLALFFRWGNYSTGDIVVMRMGDHHPVKRIVALPGDTVDISGSGRLLVNGQEQHEPYAVGQTHRAGGTAFPLVLQDGAYFVLGDNREDSLDSRMFGPVAGEHIRGRIIMVIRTREI